MRLNFEGLLHNFEQWLLGRGYDLSHVPGGRDFLELVSELSGTSTIFSICSRTEKGEKEVLEEGRQAALESISKIEELLSKMLVAMEGAIERVKEIQSEQR